MKKIYIPALLFLLSSCATNIRYVGTHMPPTKTVDVYIEEKAIRQPFNYIGKGFIDRYFGVANPEQIQKKAIIKAKQKGADAIYIYDFHVSNTETAITSISTGDSARRGIINVGNASSYQSESPGFIIYFIKYK